MNPWKSFVSRLKPVRLYQPPMSSPGAGMPATCRNTLSIRSSSRCRKRSWFSSNWRFMGPSRSCTSAYGNVASGSVTDDGSACGLLRAGPTRAPDARRRPPRGRGLEERSPADCCHGKLLSGADAAEQTDERAVTACDRVYDRRPCAVNAGRGVVVTPSGIDREPRGSRSRSASPSPAASDAAATASPRDQADAITSALRARDYDKAVELTREALKASPNDPQIWTLQGIALSRKGDTSGALAAYRRALTLSPDYIPALEGAAQLQYQAGSRDAVPLLTHLLQLRPDDPTSPRDARRSRVPRGQVRDGGRPLRKGRHAARLGARRPARLRHVPRPAEAAATRPSRSFSARSRFARTTPASAGCWPRFS